MVFVAHNFVALGFQSATSCLCSLRSGRQQLQKEGGELIDFFCEDHGTFRLDDCFGIFSTFCSRFTGAVKVSCTSVKVTHSFIYIIELLLQTSEEINLSNKCKRSPEL